MEDLTFSIYYTPDETDNSNTINYVCSDKKIHVRFRDFNSEEIIYGFERKITYLLTYLMNFSFLPRSVGEYPLDSYISIFLKTSDIITIKNCIDNHGIQTKLKGFKLKPNYHKVGECKPFGDVDPACFPLVKTDGITRSGDLNIFLNIMKVTLDEYLFNDSYMIVIRRKKENKANSKFINKQNKKDSRELLKNSGLCEIELW